MNVRQQKMAAQIRRLVSTILLREVADPRVDGLVTVTKVEVTPDLREAKVFVSLLGGTSKPKTVLQGLMSATRRIQNEVSHGLPVRVMPRLTFELDESLKKEAEFLQKINEVAREREERGAADGGRKEA